MSHSRNKVPLGIVLQQAGLVSAEQVKQAPKQQAQDRSQKIGKILADRGYIDPQTADFFAERWFNLVEEKPKQPRGQYFRQAALLSTERIQIILHEQKQTKLMFGKLAISKGWLRQTTVNFFLRHLILGSSAKSEVDQTQQFYKASLLTDLDLKRERRSLSSYRFEIQAIGESKSQVANASSALLSLKTDNASRCVSASVLGREPRS